MKRICVNCGSNSGVRPEYVASAIKLGELLSKKGIELVYGGAGVGLMGSVASAVMDNGGTVIGVIPESFNDRHITLFRREGSRAVSAFYCFSDRRG